MNLQRRMRNVIEEMTAMFDNEYYQVERAQIFQEYEKRYEDRSRYLILDGVVDPQAYEGVLFLLKEAYSREQKRGTWDLVQWVAEYGPRGMWHHVAKWAYGLMHTSSSRIAPFENMDPEAKNAVLRKIAVVNVKKVNGASASNDEDLRKYVKSDSDLLRRQIESAVPKIIVCGNTFQYLKMIYGVEPKTHCENWFYWMDLGPLKHVLVLDYFHPAVRYPELMTYYGLVNMYQQALLSEEE